MTKGKVWAIVALVGGVIAYVLWIVFQKRWEEDRIRAEIEAGLKVASWEEVETKVDAEVAKQTEALAKARADEVKALFEKAFPRNRS